MKPIIQIALDFVDLDRALSVAKESAASVDWIEAGTPLIKSEGLDCVRKLRELFPKKTIVADMKTLDTGAIEVEAAAKAGADVVNVAAAACDSTIREAVKAAKKFGVEICVDLIAVKDPVKRAREAEKLGADYVGVHTPIDEQMQGKTPFSKVKKVSATVDIPVCAAGGLNSETVVDALDSGASVLVIGGAITKSENAKKAAQDIKKAVSSKKKVKTALFKRSTDVKAVFNKVSCANISDAMHRMGEMEGLYLVSSAKKMVGPAVTVKTMPGDWAKTVEAIDLSRDSVIVIDASGVGPAVWGELATNSAIQKKVAGVVVDGAVRDSEEISEMNIPVYTQTISPTAGEPKGFGEINVPVTVGGVSVKPGDWIVGDADGIVVVPKQDAVEVANRAMDVLERENRIRKEIKSKKKSLAEVTHLLKWEKK